jgi:hypothetical protein
MKMLICFRWAQGGDEDNILVKPSPLILVQSEGKNILCAFAACGGFHVRK